MPLYSDVACPFCGCLCDDLIMEVQGDQIVRTERACAVARNAILQLNTARPPEVLLDSIPCSSEQGLDAAAGLLRNGRAPLIFGMGDTGTEAQRVAIELAEVLGGVIDTSGSPLVAASLLSLQQAGLSTCTLGEVKQRADLVIFWGADPMKTHPRHLERYSAHPQSEFLPGGRKDRILVTIHHQELLTDREADLVIKLPEKSDAEAISILRQLLRDPGREFDTTLPLHSLRALAEKMAACRYGTIFFGSGISAGPGLAFTIESLTRLVSELNRKTRFTARALGNPGAENVLAWQTGFPIAVDFQQGFPRYQPGEFSANSLLERGDVDACLLIGTEALSNLSAKAMEMLRSLPTVLLMPPHAKSELPAKVRFITSQPGIQEKGTMYRMDDVPLPLKKLVKSPYPSACSILTLILKRLHSVPSN